VSSIAAQRSVRGFAVGHRNRIFIGTDRGHHRPAAVDAHTEISSFNNSDARPWLADVLARIHKHPDGRIDDLLVLISLVCELAV
jgi:transposase